jgi:hypothetical protein
VCRAARMQLCATQRSAEDLRLCNAARAGARSIAIYLTHYAVLCRVFANSFAMLATDKNQDARNHTTQSEQLPYLPPPMSQ